MKNKNFIIRTITGFCLMLILLPAVYFGGLYYLVLTTILSYFATYELMNMFSTKHNNLSKIKYVIPLFSSLTVICFYLAINNNYNYYITMVPFILGLVFIMIYNIFKEGTDAYDITSSITSLVYGGLLFTCAVSVEYLEPIKFTGDRIVGRMFAFLYSIVVCTDVFAYFFGMLFGKHKLCPTISPKKSVEGAVAGLIFGALVGTIVGILLDVIPYDTINVTSDKILIICGIYFVSLIISLASQIGDLVASKLKRTFEIKDYGFIFPGHGGVMDRFDSLIISGAMFFIIMQIIYMFI